MTKINIGDFKQIKLLICDVDGVLTDGQLHYNNEGVVYQSFHVHDGVGLKLLQQEGFQIGIITSSPSPIVLTRMNDLGIKNVYNNYHYKLEAYEKMLNKLNLQDSDVAYMGDDIPDLPIIKKVGLSIAVANAHPVIYETANYHTINKGGFGAVREVCDLILSAHGLLSSAIEKYHSTT